MEMENWKSQTLRKTQDDLVTNNHKEAGRKRLLLGHSEDNNNELAAIQNSFGGLILLVG